MKSEQVYKSREMNPLCEQAGCDVHTANRHAFKWERKRWHSHPSQAFIAWWEPDGVDVDPSGADIGGHHEARRTWARKDETGWTRQIFGLSTPDAWNTAHYVEEFNAWEAAGSPDPITPFVSVSVSRDRQARFWKDIRQTIRMGRLPGDRDEVPFNAS